MIDVNHLCPGCMGRWEDTEKPCPRCGFSWETAPAGGRELPIFTILAGRYLLGKRIGVGGFGITYLAMDLAEERVTAIKEFFPASLASREGLEVAALPGEEGRYFREALRSFRKEADLLSRFADVPGIVSYRDYVTENGTAYLVMDYIEGTNLRRYMRETGKTFTQEEALGLMRPILLAVDAMHQKNVLHRDISPENLILKPDGTLTLIDFGAAREFSLDEEENLTVILKHGYAPEEQYHSGSRQGPWTDLYACCAVLYQMVSGIQPQDAAARARKDDLLTLDEIEGVQVTERFARIIEKGMTIHATERYASIQALMAELYGKQEEQKTEKVNVKDDSRTAASEVQSEEEIPKAKPSELKEEKQNAEKKYTCISSQDVAEVRTKAWKRNGKRQCFLIAAPVICLVFLSTLVFCLKNLQLKNKIWLVDSVTCTLDGSQNVYEYNDEGIYSKITSYNSEVHSFSDILGVSYAVDESFGEIVSEFFYEYDDNARISSSIQTTDAGTDFSYSYFYWGDEKDIPRQIQCYVSAGGPLPAMSGVINLDEEGWIMDAEFNSPEESRELYFDYTDGRCTARERFYCSSPEDKEILWNFVTEFLSENAVFEGITYEVSAEGELVQCGLAEPGLIDDAGKPLVYAETTKEMPPEFDGQVETVKMLYTFSLPDFGEEVSENVMDDFGNVTDYDYTRYTYAEYKTEDGIYIPTGRTSGSRPEAAVDFMEMEAFLFYLLNDEYGMNIATTGTEDYMDEISQKRLLYGNLDGIAGCTLPCTEEIPSGLHAVLPPEEWIWEDGTVWTVVTGDSNICRMITKILFEEGYYKEDDPAYDFLKSYQEIFNTGENQELRVEETNPVRYAIYKQYMSDLADGHGPHDGWSISNPETGETMTYSDY